MRRDRAVLLWAVGLLLAVNSAEAGTQGPARDVVVVPVPGGAAPYADSCT